MGFAPTGRVVGNAWHVAVPLEFTVTAPHPLMVTELAVKLTFPAGTTGPKEAAASCAVKVTGTSILVELDGEAVTPMVAASALTVCCSALEVLVV
jgi:hypothetical protein